jgi:hypothetical protein
MALETIDAFGLMANAYQAGLLDKVLPLVGQAISGCQEDTGLDFGDLMVKLDEAKSGTIVKLDRLLKKSGPMVRLASNKRLLGLLSRMMDLGAVRQATAFLLRKMLVRVVGTGSRKNGEV